MSWRDGIHMKRESGHYARATRVIAKRAGVVGALFIAAIAAIVIVDANQPTWTSTRALIALRFAEAKHISTSDFAAWMADVQKIPPIVLDTRTPEEFAVSHIKGAALASSEQDAMRVLHGAEKTTPIVVYCAVGYRSSAIAVALQKAGYGNVRNLDGGVFTWANESRSLVRGDHDLTPASKVHPYDSIWGKLLDEPHRSTKP